MGAVHRRPVLVAVLAVLAAGALTSCSALSGYEEGTWATHAELAASPKADRVPSLVAGDATDIRLREPTYAGGPDLLSWRSAAGVTRADCRASTLKSPAGSTPSWWPEDAPTRGLRCGWWRVFEHDGAFYAWDHQDGA